MKKMYLILIGILILIVLFFMVIRNGGEDSWIKDSRGVWVKHGNPFKIPDYVVEQQQVILEAMKLYYQKSSEGLEFSSQCLGVIGDYAVDIVHVPRNSEDNLIQNQCKDYRQGKVNHFIELNKNGEVVRIS